QAKKAIDIKTTKMIFNKLKLFCLLIFLKFNL
ncbi:unnamed protein product, partial [marine sediment metagenome]